MLTPESPSGNYITIQISGTEAVCLFPNAQLLRTVLFGFYPGEEVVARSVDVADWESTLNNAFRNNISGVAKFAADGQPTIVSIHDERRDVSQMRHGTNK